MLLDLNLKNIKELVLLQIAKEVNPTIRVIFTSAYLNNNILMAEKFAAYECAGKNSQMFQIPDQIIEETM